jgi:ABC-type bacteriocin/lantibiotic exporter with double-glycine peptidase domain
VPKHLLPIPHQPQQRDGDCLAACAAMVLAYLERPLDYNQLLQLLKFKSYGAPASNIRLLAQLNFTVTYGVTNMVSLEDMLAQGSPVIVFVRTNELPYWAYATDHALVVVGYDEANLYINDPYFPEAPLLVPRGDFELAWLERDYYYALITW